MASLAVGISSFAQTTAEPNRLFLNDEAGGTRGYVIDRMSDITFGRVDGEVKAEVQIHSVEKDALKVSVTRTAACEAFRIDVLPRSIANMLTTPTAMVNYMDSHSPAQQYSQDFTEADLTGLELVDGGDYTLVTVGIDAYGVQDGVCRANFTAPAIPVAGDPKVTATLKEATTTSFTVEFVPNSDVSSYYTVAGEKGTMEEQYEQFGPMFGFASFTEMIMKWSIEKQGTESVTWKDMAPNTEYEVYIVACDKYGNPAAPQVFETATLSMGGQGDAKVDIKLGAYKLENWDNQMMPSQFITFTPNDQAGCFRFSVYKAEQYDAQADEIKSGLCSEPPMPSMANWFFYEPITTDFQIDPATECVAIAAAKNIDGVWGEVNELRFTTPNERPTSAPATGKIIPRISPRKTTATFTQGKFPQLESPKRMTLIQK